MIFGVELAPGLIQASQMPLSIEEQGKVGKPKAALPFSDFLQKVIEDITAQEALSGELTKRFAAGERIPIHTLSIEGEKSDILLHLATSVTTKMATGFQTLMNMQV